MTFEEIKNAISEVQQPRSRFQLERFVIGQHSTREMQYYQVVIELQDMLYKYERAKLAVKKAEAKIKKLRASGDAVDEIRAQEHELGLEQTRIAMIGAQREIAHLVDIYNSFEIKFSREQIEAAQPDYWRARLTDNAKAMLMSGSTINSAHIEAMEQAGVLDDFVQEVESAKRELE
jgi:hypothetical protein